MAWGARPEDVVIRARVHPRSAKQICAASSDEWDICARQADDVIERDGDLRACAMRSAAIEGSCDDKAPLRGVWARRANPSDWSHQQRV